MIIIRGNKSHRLSLDELKSIIFSVTVGECVICGGETNNTVLGWNGESIFVHTHETGLGCKLVFRYRESKHLKMTRRQWLEYCVDTGFDFESVDPEEIRSDRDEYHDYKSYINSHEWNIKAYAAKTLTYFKCQRCGKRGYPGSLDAHHRHYDTLFNERIEDIEVLCRRCHATHHGKKHRN
jgi:5-methylcytosine-specific restriction endonuclease McrA